MKPLAYKGKILRRKNQYKTWALNTVPFLNYIWRFPANPQFKKENKT